MKALIQRVKNAKVTVDKKVTGEINAGLLVFLGIGQEDSEEDIKYLIKKITGMRIFNKEGKSHFDHSVEDVNGSILVVSQFTLYGDCKKGRRPEFTKAASPEKALELYKKFITLLKETGIKTQQGEFAAMMQVELTNDGPVTIMLDSK